MVACIHLSGQQPINSPQAKSRAELTAYGWILEADETAEAIRRAEAFLSRYPESEFREKVLEAEFEAFLKRNDAAAARRVGIRVIQVNPQNISVLGGLAFVIANQNDVSSFSVAEEYAQRALGEIEKLARDPRVSRLEFFAWKHQLQASAYSALGMLALRRKNAEEALKHWLKVVELRSEPAGIDYLRLAESWIMNKESARARGALNRAISLGPEEVTRQARQHLNRMRE